MKTHKLKDILFIVIFVRIISLLSICLTIPTLKEIWLNNDCIIIWKILIEIFVGLFLFVISFIIAGILTLGVFGEN